MVKVVPLLTIPNLGDGQDKDPDDDDRINITDLFTNTDLLVDIGDGTSNPNKP